MRFTIRDLLWLMVVVGMGCAWSVHDASWHRWFRQELLKHQKIALAMNQQVSQQIAGLKRDNQLLISELLRMKIKAKQPPESVSADSN
jgi:hypothetical protein